MAEGNGVKPSNIEESATLDYVLGNKGRSTRRQSVDKLAQQLISSGPIRAALPTSGSNTLYFATMAEMLAADIDLVTAQSNLISAWVYADPVAENNGIYRYILGTPATWQRVLDLPMQWVVAEHAEGSTGDAILADTGLPISRSLLIALPIEAENAGEEPTVSFNGGEPLLMVSNSGNPIAPAGLVPPMTIWGYVDDSRQQFHLINDQVAAAVVARAETAANLAVDAAEVARRARELAERFATAPEDEEVIPGSGLYSALHYAKKTEAITGGGLSDAIMNAEEIAEPGDDLWLMFVDAIDGNKLLRGKLSALLEKIASNFGGVPIGSMIANYGDGTPSFPGYLKVLPGLEVTDAHPDLKAHGLSSGWAVNAAGNPIMPDGEALFLRQWSANQTRDAGRVFGSIQEDAIQNITGTFGANRLTTGGVTPVTTGALYDAGGVSTGIDSTSASGSARSIGFDASRVVRTAEETRVASMTVTYYIKAYGAAINQGSLDVAKLADDVTAVSTRVATLEAGRVIHRTIALMSAANDITAIPADITRIELSYSITASASGVIVFKLGTDAEIISAGYGGLTGYYGTSSAVAALSSGISARQNAITKAEGILFLTRLGDTNTWHFATFASQQSQSSVGQVAGSITLPDLLTRLQVTTVAGTPVLSGDVNIRLEP